MFARRSIASWAVGWVLAVAVAVAVGVLAVSSLESALRDRGPIGANEQVRQTELLRADPLPSGTSGGSSSAPTPGPAAAVVRRTIARDFGALVVECRGAHAVLLGVRPASGWSITKTDKGPDDDVHAILSRPGRTAEIEVICNRGVPTTADLDYRP